MIAGTGEAVTIEVNKGSLVRLNQPASTVFIADPEICDIQVKSPTLIYLIGKKTGQTTLFAVDEADNVLTNMDITVSHNLSQLNAAISSLYPQSDINVSSVEKSVVIDGVVTSPTASEDVRRLALQFVGQETDIINRLGVDAPNQINLRVRFAEISREIEKQLGINWRVIKNSSSAGIAFATLNPFAATGVLTDVFGINATPGNWDINILLDILDQEGLASILAEPNLTAITGETASFLAGGEFPILVPQGDDQVTIEFKKFGVSLAFTPTILAEDRINLHVRPEVSQLSSEGAINVPVGNTALTVPALRTRRAETTIELGSGQSFAIAGLLSNETIHDIKKFPGLADIPVLGRLFTSDSFQRKESELVIIVTPYVVRPSPTMPAAPTDGFVAPTDWERIFPGGPWKQQPKGAPSTVGPDGARIFGPAGFALE
ncbi:MAG: type II and III secretion system protein family protein [Rhodospirillales bacterium]|nr:type II and III secretion system protein family protein [Rhodospirillales bacterium]